MGKSETELQTVKRMIERQSIVTIRELKKALGTTVERTIYRRLKRLSYRTSYSHGGTYFALGDVVQFDDDGLWCYDSVWFSIYGTLHATLQAWVEDSPSGFFAHELQDALHVSVKETLLRLVKSGRVAREKASGLYLYCAAKPAVRRRQVAARMVNMTAKDPSHTVKAAILLFFSLLDEKQRRVFAGLESLRHGRAGDTLVAELLGLNTDTVSKGRHQLIERDVQLEGVRAAGGGRVSKKKAPASSKESKHC